VLGRVGRVWRGKGEFGESRDSWRVFLEIFLGKNENTFSLFIFFLEDFF
jgi:hypothetical protein